MWKSIQGDYTRNNEPDQILDATNITFSLLALRNILQKLRFGSTIPISHYYHCHFFTIGRSNKAKDDLITNRTKK
jgi:hypothetical protein